MKTTRLSVAALAMAAMLLAAGCSSMNKTGKGALFGGGGGAALGAGIGALAGGGRGAAIGAAIGAGVGAGTGALIGKRMDKKEAELKKIADAQVEQVTDQNGLQAIKVTFTDGILFGFNSTALSASAERSLDQFASEIAKEPGFDVTIYGHTDNVGTHAVNERISTERAQVVSNFLRGHGVPARQIVAVQGLAFDSPIASNSNEAGRAQNRRVEIFLTANDHMVQQAEAGNLH